MESSRSSDLTFTLPARKHASSVSSNTSTPANPGPRKLKLTIPALKSRSAGSATPAAGSYAETPVQDGGQASGSEAPSRPKTILKIKPKLAMSRAASTAEPSPAPELPLPSFYPPPPTKPPRPMKLKPLKEVLTKLMSQIKKKDVYGFFLQPVDTEQVTGYLDVVKTPMDFGTMTRKVEEGKYRSLEQFTHDFNLVISNARAFNPPDSLYYSEASRIEAWGLDHISKASAQVIEYETDWTIDVVADNEPVASTSAAGVDGQDSGTPTMRMDEDGTTPSRARSPSVVSSVHEKGKRSRGKKPVGVSESFEPGNHLPGVRDGLGIFPPGSDLAELMLSLKLRGHRRITKKQRLKLEKEGPPMYPDGSLAFDLLEHPFSAFHQITPDPLLLPHMVPLISCKPPPPPTAAETAEGTPVPEASVPPEDEKPLEQKLSLDAVAIPPDSIDTIFANAGKALPATASGSYIGKKKLSHWTVVRNPPRRPRDVEEPEDPFTRLNKRRRAIEPTDYGSLAMLLATLAAEEDVKAEQLESTFPSEGRFVETLRASVQDPVAGSPVSARQVPLRTKVDKTIESEDYVREVVYGGIDGLAYFRSLAEFVSDCTSYAETDVHEDSRRLGMPLKTWVEKHIVDPLTNGYHSILRNTIKVLSDPSTCPPEFRDYYEKLIEKKSDESLSNLVEMSDPEAQIEIAALLHAPHELFLAETEWAGANYKPKREREREEEETKMMKENAMQFLAYTIQQESQRQAQSQSQPQGDANAPSGTSSNQGSSSDVLEIIDHALNSGADTIEELDQRIRGSSEDKMDEDRPEPEAAKAEDPLIRRLRLNLLAIAKRAPIDRIAKLPPELVPAHIRHIVPTLPS